MTLQFLIAVIAGIISGLLVFSTMVWLEGRKQARDPRLKLDRGRQLQQFFASVPIPSWIEQRWGLEETRRKLIHAGVDIEAEAFLGLRWSLLWLGIALAGLIVLVRGPSFLFLFLALVLILLSWIGPRLWLRWQIEARMRQINHGLPDLMDRLRLGLEAGLGFELALRRTVRHHGGTLGQELERVLAMLDRGHTKAETLDRLTQRNPSPDLRAFAAAVKQAERLGTSLSKTLQVQGELLRARRRRRAQEASRRLPILIVFPLVFFFLPALLIIYLGPPLLHLFLGQ